jgi:hypothetical protein
LKVSLVQIVDQLEQIATDHAQINSFAFGDVWEMSSEVKTRDYPIMFVEHPGGSTSSSGSTRAKSVGINFNIYFMDLVDKDEANELDVLSDQLRTAFDVRALLNRLDDTTDLGPLTTSSASWTTFTESEPDELAGVQLSITINTVDLFDYCQVPQV